MAEPVRINSPDVRYTAKHIEAQYDYHTTTVSCDDGKYTVTPLTTRFTFRTERRVPRLGVMLVGWGGNNGTTVTAAVLANKLGLSWRTKEGLKKANYFGSLLQASTVSLGTGPEGEVYVPFRDLLPMVHPNDIIFDGWDISSMDLGQGMERAKVLDWALQEQLRPYMAKLKPRPSVYYPEFIAANQKDRADNLVTGTKAEQLDQIRRDIQDFKQKGGVDKVIVLWTANTERFCDIIPGVNDTAKNLLAAIQTGAEVSPSTLFAVASILEGCAYINGAPQNTFVPGAVELAVQKGVFIGGDDFKSGQTKIKSVLVDFLVSAGIKPAAIVSYNHLGNNDGKNLSAPQQFRSKEISKSNVVDDMVQSNPLLYGPGEKPDHCVVIKYVPYVGDSKRAMDEYTSDSGGEPSEESPQITSISYVFRRLLTENNQDALDRLSAMAERLANHFSCYRPASDLFLEYVDSGRADEAKFLLQRCAGIAEQKRIMVSYITRLAKRPGQANKIKSLQELIPDFTEKDVYYPYLIKCYGLDNDLPSAKAVFQKMQEEGVSADELTLKRLAQMYKKADEAVPFPEPPESFSFYAQKLKQKSKEQSPAEEA